MCDYMTSLYQHWTIKHWSALSAPLQCPSATENTVHLIGLVLDCSWLSLYCALFQLRRISRNDSILFTAATLVTCSMMKWTKHTKIKHCSGNVVNPQYASNIWIYYEYEGYQTSTLDLVTIFLLLKKITEGTSQFNVYAYDHEAQHWALCRAGVHSFTLWMTGYHSQPFPVYLS